jgi:hypothetical protein
MTLSIDLEFPPSSYLHIGLCSNGVLEKTELEDQDHWRSWSSALKAVSCAWPWAQDGYFKQYLIWFLGVCSMLATEVTAFQKSEHLYNLISCKIFLSLYYESSEAE